MFNCPMAQKLKTDEIPANPAIKTITIGVTDQAISVRVEA